MADVGRLGGRRETKATFVRRVGNGLGGSVLTAIVTVISSIRFCDERDLVIGFADDERVSYDTIDGTQRVREEETANDVFDDEESSAADE